MLLFLCFLFIIGPLGREGSGIISRRAICCLLAGFRFLGGFADFCNLRLEDMGILVPTLLELSLSALLLST